MGLWIDGPQSIAPRQLAPSNLPLQIRIQVDHAPRRLVPHEKIKILI